MAFFGPVSLPLLDETSAPLIRRALHRARVVGSFASVQAAVQIISFLSGVLLIRHLDQREYGYFTIANTMQGTINVLADVGISIGLISIGGRVWQDGRRFGELVNTALATRRRLGSLAIAIVTPVLCFLLLRNGATVGQTSALVVLVLAGLVVQFSLGVLAVVPRLRSDLGRIQTIDLTGAAARLVAIVAFMFVLLNASVAVAIGSAALLLQYVLLRRYVVGVIDLQAPQNAEDRQALRGFVRNQAPSAIFFCIQGQITVFLISVFGHRVASVAEVGALGRLAMIFAVLSNLLTNVFAPAFARCQDAARLRRQYFAIVGGVAAFSGVVLAAAALVPGAFLFVLGGKYGHLESELVLMVGAAVGTALTSALWALNASKAWIAGSWLYIPLTLATQVVMIPFIDFSSVRDVLLFNLVSTLPSLLLNVVLSYRGFRALPLAAM